MARLRELLANPRAAMQITPRDAVPRYFGLSRLDNIPSMDPDERREMQQRINDVRKKLEVRLAFKNREFAFLVRDQGMRQPTDRVHSPLLSLGHTDKADKLYLIGVFG
jgi:hypothetical protein